MMYSTTNNQLKGIMFFNHDGGVLLATIGMENSKVRNNPNVSFVDFTLNDGERLIGIKSRVNILG